MGRNRLVYPEELRLMLSEGDWVDVKKELNAGEYRRLLYGQLRETDGPPTLDVAKVGIATLLAYLIRWSFVDRSSQPIPYNLRDPEDIRQATIDSLDRDTYKELMAAVNAHDERQELELAAKKNGLAIATSSAVT